MDFMDTPSADWITIAAYDNLPGCLRPMAAARAWLRDRGIDWMPFEQDEIRWGLACGIGPDGHWHGWFDIRIQADALRRLGLHPDQPTAKVIGPSPPHWWHAAAERNTH